MFRDLAEELIIQGHEVTIISGSNNITKELDITTEENVRIVRVKSPDLKTNKFTRLLNEIALGRRIWKQTKDFIDYSEFDLVIYYSPTIFWAYLVNKLKKSFKLKSYLVLRDIFPKWAVDLGLIKKYSLAHLFLKFHEYRLYRSADFIGVQSPKNKLYFEDSSFLRLFNPEVLFNWVQPDEDTNAKEISSIRKDLDIKEKVLFLYGGNIGVAQDLDNLLNLASNLKDQKNIFFLLVGEGTEFDRLSNKIIKEDINNMSLIGSVSPLEFQKIVAASDVGLVSLNRDFRTQNIPGKIMSYIKSKKPMLASINEDNDMFDIVHNKSGYVVLNGDNTTFIKYAIKLAEDKNLRRRMGENGHNLLHEIFSVESASAKILKKLS
jgi:glycosyltransferase involved in cell wall biosynthesis